MSSMKSFFKSQLVSLHRAVQAASTQARRALTPTVPGSSPPAGDTGTPAEACEQQPGPPTDTASLPRPTAAPADGRELPAEGAGGQQQQQQQQVEEQARAAGVPRTDTSERGKQRRRRGQERELEGERDGAVVVEGEAAGAQVSASALAPGSPPKSGMCPSAAGGIRAAPERSGRKGRHKAAAELQQGPPHESQGQHEPWHREEEAFAARPAGAAREQGTEVEPAGTRLNDGAKATKKEKRAKNKAAAGAAAAAASVAAAPPYINALAEGADAEAGFTGAPAAEGAEGAGAGGGCAGAPAAPPSPPTAPKVRRSARQAASAAGDAVNAHKPTARTAPSTSGSGFGSGAAAVATASAAATAFPAVPPAAEEVPAPAPAPPAAAAAPPARGVPASLAVSRGPTPALAAHAARRPRPKPLQPVAQLPVRRFGPVQMKAASLLDRTWSERDNEQYPITVLVGHNHSFGTSALQTSDEAHTPTIPCQRPANTADISVRDLPRTRVCRSERTCSTVHPPCA